MRAALYARGRTRSATAHPSASPPIAILKSRMPPVGDPPKSHARPENVCRAASYTRTCPQSLHR